MIVEKVLGKLGETEKTVDTILIEWFERDKKILKKVSQSGMEIGIRTAAPLQDGDILYEDAERIVVVETASCELIKITVSDMVEMGRLCFEIGNRHLSLAIYPDCVKIPYDEPTFFYLKKLGFRVEKTMERFTDYTECKGHGHEHGNGHGRHSHEHTGEGHSHAHGDHAHAS